MFENLQLHKLLLARDCHIKNKPFLDSLHFKILFALWYRKQGATEFTFQFTLLEVDLFLI